MKKKYDYILTREFLEDASKKGLTSIEIEKITGISYGTIREYRNKFGLISIHTLRRREGARLREKLLPNYIIGLIVGTVFGDGYLSHFTYDSVNLFISHCIKQKEYLWLKYLLLRPYLCVKEPIEEVNTGNSGIYKRYTLETICHPDLKKLRDLIYINGKKTVTKETLDLLTIPGFALWFMDDGYRNRNNIYGLSTHGFSLEENKLIREHFFKKFKIKTTILMQRNNKLNKKYYHLHFAKDTNPIFEKLVAPFIIPCMKYKMNPEALLKYQGSSETIRETSFWDYFLKDDDMVRTL